MNPDDSYPISQAVLQRLTMKEIRQVAKQVRLSRIRTSSKTELIDSVIYRWWVLHSGNDRSEEAFLAFFIKQLGQWIP